MKTLANRVSKKITIVEWLPGYTKEDLVADFVAGLTVGMTMIPQAIAYASLAGLPAQYGLYTAFIGSFTYVFFGTIKEVSIGPTSLMALLTFSYVEGYPIEFVILLTFLAGCVELLMGVLRLGFLIDFISPCVTSGFTSATSIIIVGTQLKGLFGLKIKGHGFLETLIQLFSHITEVRLADTLLGLFCIIFLYAFKQLTRIPTRNIVFKKSLWLLSISKNAILVIITSLVAFYLHEYKGGAPFYLSGQVPQGLPELRLPSFSATLASNETVSAIGMVQTLGSGILVVPLVAILANVAIAKSFAHATIVDASQEMMTLGLCNILGSFVQAMPSCGAFTRSAVASNSDVRTPLHGIYSGTIIILALSFLTPYFYYIPKAVLSAILVSAVVTLIDYEIYPKLWKLNKFDFWITVITLISGLVWGADAGIMIGTLLNLIILLKFWSRPKILIENRTNEKGEEYIYIKPELGLYYPGIDYLSQEILKAHLKNKYLSIALDCSNVLNIDYAAAQTLNNLINTYNNKATHLMVLNVNRDVFNYLEKVVDIGNLYLCQCSEDLCKEFMKKEEKTPKLCSELSLLLNQDANCQDNNVGYEAGRKKSIYDNA